MGTQGGRTELREGVGGPVGAGVGWGGNDVPRNALVFCTELAKGQG